jgi:hypothetical protein
VSVTEASKLFYRAALPLLRKTLTCVAWIIRRHRKAIGSLWRKPDPGQHDLGNPLWRAGRDARAVVAYGRWQGDPQSLLVG